MSGFVFGTLTFLNDYSYDSYDELDDIAWQIFRLGDKHSVYFIFDPNIKQKSVCEMIDEQIREKSYHLRYLLTTSPVQDTTDNFVIPIENPDEYGKAILENMSSLASLIKSIVEIEEVKNMVVFIVEGEDIEFKKIKTDSKGIHEAIIREIDEDGDMPSVMFEVEE
jgi:CRISPR/Cas system-associated protein Cas5 (RAMP superfamily)